MILRAWKKVPTASFEICGIFNEKLPSADIIIMVGGILSYALADEIDAILRKFFMRVYRALNTDGLFLFDVLENLHDYSKSKNKELINVNI